MIFDDLIIKCCYNCEKFQYIMICGLNGYWCQWLKDEVDVIHLG